MSAAPAIRADILVELERLGVVSPTGLVLPETMALDRYESLGRMLGQLGSAVKWWVGDWLAFGEEHYGPLAAQLSEALDMSPEGRQECVRVALAFPPAHRRPGLTFSHHRAAAGRWLTPEQRERLLDIAEEERLTNRELEAHVRHVRELVGEQDTEAEVELDADLSATDGDSLHGEGDEDADCAALVDECAVELRRELLACGFPFDRVRITVEAGHLAGLVAILDREAAA